MDNRYLFFVLLNLSFLTLVICDSQRNRPNEDLTVLYPPPPPEQIKRDSVESESDAEPDPVISRSVPFPVFQHEVPSCNRTETNCNRGTNTTSGNTDLNLKPNASNNLETTPSHVNHFLRKSAKTERQKRETKANGKKGKKGKKGKCRRKGKNGKCRRRRKKGKCRKKDKNGKCLRKGKNGKGGKKGKKGKGDTKENKGKGDTKGKKDKKGKTDEKNKTNKKNNDKPKKGGKSSEIKLSDSDWLPVQPQAQKGKKNTNSKPTKPKIHTKKHSKKHHKKKTSSASSPACPIVMVSMLAVFNIYKQIA